MVIKNLRQLFFGFFKNSFANQYPTDPLCLSTEPLLSVLITHVVEVPVLFIPII